MSETILINSLPTRTWNRLGVNETALTWGESADLGTERITAAGQTVRLDIAGSGEYSEQTVDIQALAGQTVTVFETLRAEDKLPHQLVEAFKAQKGTRKRRELQTSGKRES